MNVEQLLRESGVEFKRHGEHHHVSRGWVGVDCPRCSPNSHRYRLGFHVGRLFASCWSCGWRPLRDALADLGVPTGSLRELSRRPPEGRMRRPEAGGRVVLPKGLGPLLEPHRRYLRGRGFVPEELEEVWGVMGLGLAGKLSWRVWVPVQVGGETVSWTTRSISNEPGVVRYLTAKREEEKVSAKDVLFGEDHCSHAIMVCEGSFDAMAIGPGAVATMGMTVSESQVSKMSKYPVRVICFDSEPQAQARARRLCDDLSAFPGDTYRVELSGKDAASSPREEIRELRETFLS